MHSKFAALSSFSCFHSTSQHLSHPFYLETSQHTFQVTSNFASFRYGYMKQKTQTWKNVVFSLKLLLELFTVTPAFQSKCSWFLGADSPLTNWSVETMGYSFFWSRILYWLNSTDSIEFCSHKFYKAKLHRWNSLILCRFFFIHRR